MDTDEVNPKPETVLPQSTSKPKSLLPEVDLYIHLLVLVFAIDRQKNTQVVRYQKIKNILKFLF